MKKKFKWEIDGLDNSVSLIYAAKKSLSARLTTLLDFIKIYFDKPSEENLHQVRISLRRVRYNLELFYSCFDERIFDKFYKRIVKLQDLTGDVRDIDIMKRNLLQDIDFSYANLEKIINKFELKRNVLLEKMNITLFRFTFSKTLKEFLKQLDQRGG